MAGRSGLLARLGHEPRHCRLGVPVMSGPWRFRLYVAGQTPLGQRALGNLETLVARHLPDGADIEVVDLKEDPREAVEARILAVPTAVRVLPEPEVRVIGDLSNEAEVQRALELPPAP